MNDVSSSNTSSGQARERLHVEVLKDVKEEFVGQDSESAGVIALFSTVVGIQCRRLGDRFAEHRGASGERRHGGVGGRKMTMRSIGSWGPN